MKNDPHLFVADNGTDSSVPGAEVKLGDPNSSALLGRWRQLTSVSALLFEIPLALALLAAALLATLPGLAWD